MMDAFAKLLVGAYHAQPYLIAARLKNSIHTPYFI
jgi:hypothetical protein